MIFFALGILILVVSFIIAFISLAREGKESVGDQEINGSSVIKTSKNPALGTNTNISDESQLNLQSTQTGLDPNLSSISKVMQPRQAQDQEVSAKTESFPWEQQASVDLEAKPETSDDQDLEPTERSKGVISLQDLANKREI